MIVDIPLGEWLPDRPDQKNALVKAEGVVADAGCYRPIPSLAASGTSLPSGISAGSFRTSRTTGQSITCTGTSSDLYVIVGAVVTASGLALSLGTNPIWVFERFGRYVYATAGGVTYYLSDLDSVSVFVAATGSPPRARAMGRVGDFLMLGNLTQDIDTSFAPYRVRWSAFNNPAGTWTDDIATQSGYVDMDSAYDEVTAIAGGRYGLICQKDAVSRIAYTGGSSAFAKELIEEQRGCIAPASLVRVGARAFALGRDGFWQSDGAAVQLLSAGRVWEWFQANADLSLIDKTQAAIDYRNRCIWWNFFTPGGSARGRQLIWSWEQNRWSAASLSADWLFSTRVSGTLIDPSPFGDTLIDSVNDLVDSSIFADGDRLFSGFSGVSLQTANGASVEATLETGELQPAPGYRAMVRGVAPMMEGNAATAQIAVGVRTALTSEPVAYSAESTPGPQGFAPQRKDGRYVRVKARIPAGTAWSKASAMQVDFVTGGRA